MTELERDLFHAIASGNITKVNELIAQGVNVNASSPDLGGCTPLHVAVRRGMFLLIERLISAGANVNAKDDDGRTVLYCAGLFYPSALEVLLAAGANPCTLMYK